MEKTLDLFDIKISNLTDGTYDYSFEVNDEFLSCFEASQVKSGRVKANITLEKSNNTWKLEIDLEGTVQLNCNRCLNEIPCPISGEMGLILKTDSAPVDDFNAEIEFIPFGAIKINVACYIYECLQLSLPLQVFCDQQSGNTCDEEVIAFLEKQKINSSEKSFLEAFKELRLKQ